MKFVSACRRTLVLAVMLAATGCATVTRGVHETWSVNTDPSGAQVKTSNGFACDQTPCTFRMERKTEFEVTISKSGYKPYHGRVTHAVANGGAAGMAGNVLLGGLIGAGVDVTSGAMLDLKPNPLEVKLEVDASAPVAASNADDFRRALGTMIQAGDCAGAKKMALTAGRIDDAAAVEKACMPAAPAAASSTVVTAATTGPAPAKQCGTTTKPDAATVKLPAC